MKKLLLLFFLHFSLIAFNQNEQLNLKSSSVVTTLPYFEKDEARTYHVTETSETFKKSSTKPSESITKGYDILIKVKDNTDTSYIMEMTYKNFKDNDIKKKKDEEAEFKNALKNITENLIVQYRTDENGTFDTILNLPELAEKIAETMELTIDELITKMEIKDQDKIDAIKKTLGLIKEMFIKPENVEILFLDDINIFHSMYGFELTLNKSQDLEIDFNLFNNQHIKGIGTINLTGINKAKDDCKFDMNEKPNAEELANYLKDLIQYFVPEKDIKKGKTEDFKYNSTIKISYTMSLSKGWMDKISMVTKINTSNNKNVTKILKKKDFEAI